MKVNHHVGGSKFVKVRKSLEGSFSKQQQNYGSLSELFDNETACLHANEKVYLKTII